MVWTVQRKRGFTSWSKVTYNKNLKIFPITPSIPHWTPPINSQKLSQKFKKYWYKINCVNQQVKSVIRKSKKRAKKRVSLAHRHSSSLCTVMIRNWRGFRDLYFLNLPWTCLASILLLGPRRTASKHSMFLRHVSTISSWIFPNEKKEKFKNLMNFGGIEGLWKWTLSVYDFFLMEISTVIFWIFYWFFYCTKKLLKMRPSVN